MKCSKMIRVLLIPVFTFYCAAQALECGIHMNRNKDLKLVISKCVKSNKTLEDLWDITPMSSESDSSSSEEQAPVDSKMSQNFRIRRAPEKIPETDLQDSSNDTEQAREQTTETVSENCMIQCIFDNLQMTDNSGYPEHTKILEGLMRNASNAELKDFLQDTTDQCFQEMDKDVTMDPCTYSVKLVTCLAEKGKSNCADWPVGDLPLHQ